MLTVLVEDVESFASLSKSRPLSRTSDSVVIGEFCTTVGIQPSCLPLCYLGHHGRVWLGSRRCDSVYRGGDRHPLQRLGWGRLRLLRLATPPSISRHTTFLPTGVLSVVMVTRIISVDEGLAGFSNEAPLTVAGASTVGETSRRTFSSSALRRGNGHLGNGLLGCSLPSRLRKSAEYGVSHGAHDVARDHSLCLHEQHTSCGHHDSHRQSVVPEISSIPGTGRVPISVVGTVQMHFFQLYIPLSFASMLGGTCTLIGTSTNLVVAGGQSNGARGNEFVRTVSRID